MLRMGETVREELLDVDGAGFWRCLMESRWSTLAPDQVLSTQNKFFRDARVGNRR